MLSMSKLQNEVNLKTWWLLNNNEPPSGGGFLPRPGLDENRLCASAYFLKNFISSLNVTLQIQKKTWKKMKTENLEKLKWVSSNMTSIQICNTAQNFETYNCLNLTEILNKPSTQPTSLTDSEKEALQIVPSLLELLVNIINILPEILERFETSEEETYDENWPDSSKLAFERLKILNEKRSFFTTQLNFKDSHAGLNISNIILKALKDIELINPLNENLKGLWNTFHQLIKKLNYGSHKELYRWPPNISNRLQKDSESRHFYEKKNIKE